jgi:hypothetical protein
MPRWTRYQPPPPTRVPAFGYFDGVLVMEL